jgi:hypothetical protein
MSTVSPPPPVVRKSRRRWFYFGAFVLLLMATPFGIRSFAVWQRDHELAAIHVELDAQDPNWRWPDLVASLPAPPPDEQNAAALILKVGRQASGSSLGKFVHPASVLNKPNYRLHHETAKSLHEKFERLDPAFLDGVRKLKDLPDGRFKFKVVENPFDSQDQFAFQFDLLDVICLLTNDAMRRADDGDTEGAAESCQAALHSLNAINDAPTLMAGLIRIAGRMVAVPGVERTLGHGSVSEKRLKLLQAALVREAECRGLYDALRGERAFTHHAYFLLSEGKVEFPSEFRRTGWKGWVDILFPAYSLGDHPDELRLYNELVAVCQLNDELQPAAFDAVQKKKANRKIGVAPSILTLISSLVAEHLSERARARCAVMAIAAERYRLAHGRWPESATELVNAGFLKAAYKDPFDGQPLRWKRTATGLIIYSVGPDRTDNDGKLDRRSAGLPGTDVGFELWLPNHRRLPAPADTR